MAQSTATRPLSVDDLGSLGLARLDGTSTTLGEFAGKTLLVVNVASRCGFTPQYAGLEQLYKDYAARGLVILGFPCNQFGAQEPGTSDEIASFCSVNFGVTFPLFQKIDVNGESRHPLYARLTEAADHKGRDGDVVWNFEKFLIAPDGEVVGRFGPQVEPGHPALIQAIEATLPLGS